MTHRKTTKAKIRFMAHLNGNPRRRVEILATDELEAAQAFVDSQDHTPRYVWVWPFTSTKKHAVLVVANNDGAFYASNLQKKQ